jgi:hypothetical protein
MIVGMGPKGSLSCEPSYPSSTSKYDKSKKPYKCQQMPKKSDNMLDHYSVVRGLILDIG